MATFEQQFTAFSKFGDSKSDGKTITLSQSDKWMKQANVFDKTITTTDTGICFKKMKVQKMTIGEYNQFIQDLASSKKVDSAELLGKMAACGAPGNPAAAIKTTETVDRLTDTSKYTGTHKERFDESGKGKGVAGREDVVDDAGYVTGYKNKDTYGKK